MNASWMPNGRFIGQTDDDNSPIPQTIAELDEFGGGWAPWQASFFDRNADRARKLINQILVCWERQRF